MSLYVRINHTVMHYHSNDVWSVTHTSQCLCKPTGVKIYTCRMVIFFYCPRFTMFYVCVARSWLPFQMKLPIHSSAIAWPIHHQVHRHAMNMWLRKNSISPNKPHLTSSSYFCATYELWWNRSVQFCLEQVSPNIKCLCSIM